MDRSENLQPASASESSSASETPSAAGEASSVSEAQRDFYHRADKVSDPHLGLVLKHLSADQMEEALQQYLSFRLGQRLYAMELAGIREIAKVPPITEVPRAPALILGVINLRGEVMPIFSLHRRLGLPNPEKLERGARVIVVQTSKGPTGMLVDAVEQVIRLRPSLIETCPEPAKSGEQSSCFSGLARLKDQTLSLLQLNKVLEF